MSQWRLICVGMDCFLNVPGSLWEQPLACDDAQTLRGNYLMESGKDCLQPAGQTLGLLNLLVHVSLWGCTVGLESLRPEKGLDSKFCNCDMSGYERRQLCVGEAALGSSGFALINQLKSVNISAVSVLKHALLCPHHSRSSLCFCCAEAAPSAQRLKRTGPKHVAVGRCSLLFLFLLGRG